MEDPAMANIPLPTTDPETESHELPAYDLQVLEALIEEHLPFDCDVIPIDSRTWAIHGSIPVDGEVILAEFHTKEDAYVALALLAAAENRQERNRP
jgi:hypothetical protein